MLPLSYFFCITPAPPIIGAVVYASKTFRGHTEVVEDVAWHRHHRDLFASCGDDKVRVTVDIFCVLFLVFASCDDR